ncbi:UNVERIFIED_CONTAM: hypothetical protein DES50_102757 [Williamsia faeni]
MAPRMSNMMTEPDWWWLGPRVETTSPLVVEGDS